MSWPARSDRLCLSNLTGNPVSGLRLAVRHLIPVGADWRDTGDRFCRTGWDTSCVPAHSTTSQSGPLGSVSKTSANRTAASSLTVTLRQDIVDFKRNLGQPCERSPVLEGGS